MEKCIKGTLLSGVHVEEAAEDVASKSGVDDFSVSPGCSLFFVKSYFKDGII